MNPTIGALVIPSAVTINTAHGNFPIVILILVLYANVNQVCLIYPKFRDGTGTYKESIEPFSKALSLEIRKTLNLNAFQRVNAIQSIVW